MRLNTLFLESDSLVGFLAAPLDSTVTLGKSLNLPVSGFSQFENADNNATYLIRYCRH